ncbi:MAG: ethanolamine utilization protein EutH [Clostridia bacterium]|nr:ethanolamine utilization protein EutH [Clostridia bacterium]
MEYALSVTMAIFALIGAIDRMTGNHLKLGDEFEKGIHTIAPLTMSMLGMITIAPTLSDILLPVIKPVANLFRFDPSAIAGIVFANDMGGAALADSVCENALLGSFHGLVVASMLGATISFTIPVSISSISKEHHKDVFLGLLCGISTIPVGCFVSGLVMGVDVLTLILNLVPIIIFSLIIVVGLLKIPGICIKIFGVLGKAILILVTAGLAIGILQYLTKWTILEKTTPIDEGFKIIFHIGVVLSGTFPLIAIVSKLLNKPFKKLGEKTGLDETSVLGFVATLANSIATIENADKMNRKGRVLNLAFCVSGAFVFGDHLAFTLSYNGEHILAVIIGKLVAGAVAVVMANFAVKKIKI